jgi:hypothetical protein
MKDAVVAAAEELGQIDRDKWAEEIRKGDPENGMKRYFKILAVEEMRTFGGILARIMPLHISTTGNRPMYLTEEQLIAEFKEAGIPLEVIQCMRSVGASTVDLSEIGPNPYEQSDTNTLVVCHNPNHCRTYAKRLDLMLGTLSLVRLLLVAVHTTRSFCFGRATWF